MPIFLGNNQAYRRQTTVRTGYNTPMKSIYDISLNSADGSPNFLAQFKGKVTLLANTTVGCGNANQMEVLQWLQDKYGGDDFQVIAIPTNDYCGVGITKGKWSQGITCGADSQAYGKDVYGTTFQFSEMVSSNPNESANELSAHKGDASVNGLGQPRKETHELYREIKDQMHAYAAKQTELGIPDRDGYLSPWLNQPIANGAQQGGNFEKYLIDKDGYVANWFQCTVLNYDIEKTLKEALAEEGSTASMGEGRTPEVFQEEYALVQQEIEKLIAGDKSLINN
jgi:glutathione peroxidase-family protein